jgi:selenocysteine-specific elongation factor
MHVIATAGHVDHGKSALVRALTGMEPDRWAEERRRGMTIDLGFAWTTLESGAEIAFVDVPGHERFIGNMLAGVGPAPAVMFVVAADEGWQPQAEEHLQALDALAVEPVLLVITKTDLADPGPAREAAYRRFAATGISPTGEAAVSAATGTGLFELAAALDRLTDQMPLPDRAAPVRLWVDRAFTITGAGTVVTGTLTAGTIRVGDVLRLDPAGRAVTVRALHTCGQPANEVTATARVALNLRGVDRADVGRGMALTTPNEWWCTTDVDVLVSRPVASGDVVVHVGSATVPARVRRLDDTAVRVRLVEALPLHLGDRLLLRHPQRRTVVGADVVDIEPAALRRRGDAGRVAAELQLPVSADAVVRRRGAVTEELLRATGCRDDPVLARRVAGWWVAAEQWEQWRRRLPDVVAGQSDAMSTGVSVESARRLIEAPAGEVVAALADEVPGLALEGGWLRATAAEPSVAPELIALTDRLDADPLAAPDAVEVRSIGPRVLALGVRSGRLLHLGQGVYVAPHAPELVLDRLTALPQPFTVSEARQALNSSRRVVLPLLEHLDAARVTRRLADGTRLVLGPRG